MVETPSRPSLAATVLALAVILGLCTACSSGDDGGDDARATEAQTCIEQRLTDGTGYGPDPGLAIGLTRAIEMNHPELSGIVDAVARYHADHPDPESLDLDDVGDLREYDGANAENSLWYVVTLFSLSERPDLATPELLAGMEEVASQLGMGGIHDMMINPAYYPDHDLTALAELSELVAPAAIHVGDAGVQALPRANCG